MPRSCPQRRGPVWERVSLQGDALRKDSEDVWWSCYSNFGGREEIPRQNLGQPICEWWTNRTLLSRSCTGSFRLCGGGIRCACLINPSWSNVDGSQLLTGLNDWVFHLNPCSAETNIDIIRLSRLQPYLIQVGFKPRGSLQKSFL